MQSGLLAWAETRPPKVAVGVGHPISSVDDVRGQNWKACVGCSVCSFLKAYRTEGPLKASSDSRLLDPFASYLLVLMLLYKKKFELPE